MPQSSLRRGVQRSFTRSESQGHRLHPLLIDINRGCNRACAVPDVFPLVFLLTPTRRRFVCESLSRQGRLSRLAETTRIKDGADCEIEFEKKANLLSNHRHPGVLSRKEETTNEPESACQPHNGWKLCRTLR